MKLFHNEEIYIKTDNFSDSIFKENTMFFDIETTGFSPVKAIVYMIGCATVSYTHLDVYKRQLKYRSGAPLCLSHHVQPRWRRKIGRAHV